MPLPALWVDRIFSRLLVRYGAAWMRLWDGIEDEVVKADWAEVLDGLPGYALTYGLEHLPDERPPATAQAFRAICLRRPDPPTPALGYTPSKAKPEVMSRLRDSVEVLRSKNGNTAWADRLAQRAESGQLTAAQQQMWRAASRAAVMDFSAIGQFNPPPVSSLPPGMRDGDFQEQDMA